MSRSKFMRWTDRLGGIKYSMFEYYHSNRIKYYNKPEKTKILDDWISTL